MGAYPLESAAIPENKVTVVTFIKNIKTALITVRIESI
jgi:hypothetical protein